MFTIRSEQFAALEKSYLGARAREIAADLYYQYPHARTSPTFHEDVAGWTEDASALGLRSDHLVRKFVEAKFVNHYRRPPLAERIARFLREQHPELASEGRLEDFVEKVLELSPKVNVTEEEGVTWLAVLLLAAQAAGHCHFGWAEDFLKSTSGHEEQRLAELTSYAVAQGWIRT